MPPGSARKALLLRVGIDRGTGGALAPIFADGRFEYVPIPEPGATGYPSTFAALPARCGGSLAVFVPRRTAGLHPHIDPDFVAWTYGDAAPNKRCQLLRLGPGDPLVFYAGLEPRPAEDIPRLYVIGWHGRGGPQSRPAGDPRRPGIAQAFREHRSFFARPARPAIRTCRWPAARESPSAARPTARGWRGSSAARSRRIWLPGVAAPGYRTLAARPSASCARKLVAARAGGSRRR